MKKMKIRKAKNSPILSIIFMIFIVYATITLAGQLIKFVHNNNEISRINKEIEMTNIQKSKLEEQKKWIESDDYIERVAKEKLNMVGRDEVLVDMNLKGQK